MGRLREDNLYLFQVASAGSAGRKAGFWNLKIHLLNCRTVDACFNLGRHLRVTKRKISLGEFQQARKNLLKKIAIQVKTVAIGRETECNSTDTKGSRVCKCWGEPVGKCYRTLGQSLVNGVTPSLVANVNLLKVGSYLP